MLRTVLLVAAGLIAGFAAAYWLAGSTPAADAPVSSAAAPTPTPSELPARITELERQLRAEIERRGALEQRVGDLSAQLDELHAAASPARARTVPAESIDTAAAAPDAAGGPPGFARRFRGASTTDQRVELLVNGGFSPDRAAWIEKRTSELMMQTIQAQYAQRRGENVDPAQLRAPEQTLRSELGDSDYERYLAAQGRPTTIPVLNVLASSPAEKAGMQPGDQILSYAGQRVFDTRELNDLTAQGAPGQSVTIEVKRDQQTVQLVIPRGPIGITGGVGGGQFPGGQFGGRRP